jgi:hypothetical protein
MTELTTHNSQLKTSLDLGPITRLLVQCEDDHRAGLTMATSDVRAMVDEIVRLSHVVLQAREYAYAAQPRPRSSASRYPPSPTASIADTCTPTAIPPSPTRPRAAASCAPRSSPSNPDHSTDRWSTIDTKNPEACPRPRGWSLV